MFAVSVSICALSLPFSLHLCSISWSIQASLLSVYQTSYLIAMVTVPQHS